MQQKDFRRLVCNARGFTLVEIMIVLIILGGLMALLGQRVVSGLEKAKVKQATVAIGQVMKALDQYYADCGSYPPSLDALITQNAECGNWGPEPYIKGSMLNDPWNTKFDYQGTGANFVLKSLGRDRREGGAGYDKDLSSEEI